MAGPPDVVYLVRRGDRNPELKYSLRSLRNMPHGRVVVVGHRPNWLGGVTHVAGNRNGAEKALNIFDNLRLACDHVDADRFVLMNDDFFIMEPVDGPPSWHRGRLADHLARVRQQSAWRTSLQTTLDWLRARGHDDPLSFAVHAPMPFEVAKLAEVLDLAAGPRIPPGARSIYGNWWNIPAVEIEDPKVRCTRDGWTPGMALASTDDQTFRHHRIGQIIRARFARPSEFERTTVSA